MDPGTIKFVLVFGGAFVVAVWGLVETARRAREFERERTARAMARTDETRPPTGPAIPPPLD